MNTAVTRTLSVVQFSQAIWLALLVPLSILVHIDAWRDMLSIAIADEEQSHVLIVPLVAVWLFLVRIGRLRRYTPVGRPFGVAILLAAWGLSYIGYTNAIQSAWHGAAVLSLVGALVTFFGTNFFLRFLPVFVVLLFLIPVPGTIRQNIAMPLQTATAVVTQAVLETLGFAIDRQTNLLTINGQAVAVAEACNGMRMVFALILVSFAFAFSMPLRPSVRLIVLVISPVAALVCNIVRLVPTVLCYGYAPKSTADMVHDLGGWVMLPIAFLLLLGIISTLRWAAIPVGRFNLAYQ